MVTVLAGRENRRQPWYDRFTYLCSRLQSGPPPGSTVAAMRHPCWLLLLLLPVTVTRAAVPARAEELFDLDLEALRAVKVVTAARRPQSIDDAPGAITVFSREQLDSLGVRTLDELLNFVPGMRTYTFVGPDTSGKTVIESRGVYEPYGHMMLLLLDGQRLSAAYNGNFTGANRWLSLTAIERVEIIRGPASALYGGNAVTAVINLISLRDQPRQQVMLESGGFDHQRAALQTGDGVVGARYWRAWLEWQRDDGDRYSAFDPLQLDDSTADPRRGRDALLSAGVDNLQLQLRHHWRRSDDFYLLGRMADDINYSETEQNNARLSWRTGQPEHEVTLALAWLQASWQGLTRLARQGTPPFFAGDFLGGPALRHEEWQLSADAIWHLNDGNVINYGLAAEEARIPRSAAYGNYDTLDFSWLGSVQVQDDDAHRIVADQDRQLLGGYLQWDHRLDNDLRAVLGARFDHYQPGDQALTPRLALLWQRDDNNHFEWQYAQAYRPPSQADQFVQETPVLAASETLEPIRSHTLEASWQYRDSSFDSELTVYALQIDNLIGRLPLPDGRVRIGNSGELHTRGIEWSLSAQLQARWLLRLNAGHVLAVDTDNAPPDVALSEHYASRDVWSVISHWRGEPWQLDLQGQWARAVTALPDNGDYLQWHAHLRIPLGAEWELYAGVRNLTGETVLAAEPGSGLGTDLDGNIVRELPQRGRQWLLGLRWRSNDTR